MPAEEGGLRGVYYGISDKAWAFAEWLEAKGVPLASFCDKHHINPLLLLLVIAVAVILLLVLAMGAIGGVSYGTLSVTVTSNTQPVDGATVSYYFGGKLVSNNTNVLGKAQLAFPIGPELDVTASKDGYNANTTKGALTGQTGSLQISLARKVGTLKVNVNVAGGRDLPSGSYVFVTGPVATPDQKRPINGVATFENLPAGIAVTVYLNIGNQKFPPGGQQVTIQEGKTVEVPINVPESALKTSLTVTVVDSLGQNVDGAIVQLFNWATGMSLSDPQTTFGGVATFNAIAIGTSAYVTVNPPDAQYSSYNGKTAGNKLDITGEGLTYRVELQVAGRVRVCVYDENGVALNRGIIRIKGTTGASYATKDVIHECEEFTGLPEGVSIYPTVTASGFRQYSGAGNPQTVDYSRTTTFSVNMEPLGAGDTVNVYVHVSDCDGNAVSGMKVKVIDASNSDILDEGTTQCGGSATVTIPTCGNILSSIASGTMIYAIAFDDDHQLVKSGVEVAEEGKVLDVISCKADANNAGDVEVCAYKNGNPFSRATIELYDSSNYLRWTARTDDDEDDKDSCYTFKNIPDGETVYAKALNLGSSAEVSDTVQIVGGETGSLRVYSGTAPVILDKGDIKVCVRDAASNTSLTAGVKIYDHATDQLIEGHNTATGGCWLFQDLTAEANIGGQVAAREIYVVANKTGYATYNGVDEEAILEMVPNGTLTINIYLPESFPICVQLRASDTSEALDGEVVLYYNKTADTPIDSVDTANGTARFYQAMKDKYYFRVSEEYTLYEPEDVYDFTKAQVSGGNCGVITIYDLGTLCDLGAEVLDSGKKIRVVAGTEAQVPLRVIKDGDRGDLSIASGSLGNKQKVLLVDENYANVTLRLNGAFKQFSLSYGATTYSSDEEIIASFTIDDSGTYSGLFDVTENLLCSRQAAFNIEAYVETLSVTTDSVSFDPVTQTSVSFCVYVTDQDGDPVIDASVQVQVDDMDGWAQSSSRGLTYDEVKRCYKGQLAAAWAPRDTNGKYKSGTYHFSVIAKRGDVTKIADGEATITVTDQCGNGKLDSGEKCDASATNTGCPSGYACNDDCTACSEEQCGSLRVSAGTATLSVGSGLSSGFCVNVKDDCDDPVTDATVTATFDGSGGWYQTSTVSASYNIAKSCYYVPVSENLLLTYGYGMSASNTRNLIGSKTISIAAVKGSRTATTSTSAVVTCGCDRESWCEANCVCDDDCTTGGSGSLNLFGCLQVAGSQGYYPSTTTGIPYSSYNPYGYTYSNPYVYGYNNNPYLSSGYGTGVSGQVGGLSMSPGMIGIGSPNGGYLGLNWEQCKELLSGVGLFSSNLKGYVLINDYVGLTRTSAGCTSIQNNLKSLAKDFKYMHVQNLGTYNTGASTCCTGTGGLFSSGSCDFDKFQKLMESAIGKGDVTIINIVLLDEANVASIVGGDVTVIDGTDGKKVLYSKSRGLFGNGAVVFARANPSGSTKANNYYTLGILPDQTGQPSQTLLTAVANNLAALMALDGLTVRYPSSLVGNAQYTNVILTSKEDTAAGIDGVVITEGSDLKAEYFTGKLSPNTKLYVFSDYSTAYDSNSQIGAVAKSLDGNTNPKFEKVTQKFTYCPGTGQAKEFTGWSNPILLRIDSKAYLTGDNTLAQTCGNFLTDGKMKLTLDQATAEKLGYVKKISSDRYLVMASKPDLTKDVVSEFKKDGLKITSSSRIYTFNDYWTIISAQCRATLKCSFTSPYQTDYEANKKDLVASLGSVMNLPAGANIGDHLLSCICGGKAENPPAILSGTITKKGISDPLAKSEITVRIQPVNGRPITYNLGDDSDPNRLEVIDKTDSIDFKIKDVSKDWGSSKVWATWEKAGTGTNQGVCYMSDIVVISMGELKPGVENKFSDVSVPKTATLELKAQPGGFCVTDPTTRSFKITGVLRDSKNNPLSGIKITAGTSDTDTSITPVTPTDDEGKFTVGPFTYTDGAVVVVKAVISNTLTARADVKVSASDATVSGSTSFTAPTNGQYEIKKDLQSTDAVYVCAEGSMKNCDNGQVLSGGVIGFKGATATLTGSRGFLTGLSPGGGSFAGSAVPPQAKTGKFGVCGIFKKTDSISLVYNNVDVHDFNNKGTTATVAVSSLTDCTKGYCYYNFNDVCVTGKAAQSGGSGTGLVIGLIIDPVQPIAGALFTATVNTPYLVKAQPTMAGCTKICRTATSRYCEILCTVPGKVIITVTDSSGATLETKEVQVNEAITNTVFPPQKISIDTGSSVQTATIYGPPDADLIATDTDVVGFGKDDARYSIRCGLQIENKGEINVGDTEITTMLSCGYRFSVRLDSVEWNIAYFTVTVTKL